MEDRRNQTRKHYIHKISYSVQERIVGLFVIVAVGTLIWLLLSAGTKTTIFKETTALYGQLESAQGITKDTVIKISGLNAGTIESIDIKQSNELIVTMNIENKFYSLLHSDASAKLTNPGIAVLGGSVIDITTGSKEKPELEAGSTIKIERIASLEDTLNQIVPTFELTQKLISNLNAILVEINPETIGYTFDNLSVLTSDMRKITRQVRNGNNIVNSVLYNKDISDNTKTLLANLVEITQLMEVMVATLNKEIADMPELVDKIGPLLNQADKTIKATQRIWPLSSAIGEETNTETLTSPAPAND